MRTDFDFKFYKGYIYHLDDVARFSGLIDTVDSSSYENVNKHGEPNELGDHCKFNKTVVVKASIKVSN